MSRWIQFDEDLYRLPEGMKRIAYDADAKVYTFRDREGKLYQGPPSEDYGVLTLVPETTTITRRGVFADSDVALQRKAAQANPLRQPASFEDFLPSHVITKATSPIDARPNPLSPLSPASLSNAGERPSRITFKEAVRKTALPKMQGVVHNLRRSMTTAQRTSKISDGESTRLLRGNSSVDLSRNSSLASSRTAVTEKDSVLV